MMGHLKTLVYFTEKVTVNFRVNKYVLTMEFEVVSIITS